MIHLMILDENNLIVIGESQDKLRKIIDVSHITKVE